MSAGGTYDVVVAGAGHNSLVAAAYLAMAGLRCIVLEARGVVGGNTASEELTLPGVLHDTCASAHNLIQASPTIRENELRLDDYGLEYIRPDPVVHMPFPDGSWLTQWRDLNRTCEEFARFSHRDAQAYRRINEEYEAIKDAIGGYRYTPAGWGPSLDERLAAAPNGRKWLRRQAMSAWDVIRSEFEDPHTQAFMLWMSFMTVQPPDRPGTGLLAYSLAYGRQRHSWTIPTGGSGALPQALTRCIEAHGGDVVTNQPVNRLILDGDRCIGVETAGGEQYHARRAVLSTIHVKHLVEMAPHQAWGDDFLYGVDTWRPGVSFFVAHYATTQPPRFAASGGDITSVASGIAPSVDRLLRVGSDFTRRIVASDDPPLLVVCPTVADSTRAPNGLHTLKVIGFQPYELPGGATKWDEIKAQIAEANLAQLQRFAPNITQDTILAASLKSPLDLERLNAHNWHGSCHGGDMSSAQSGRLRPVPGWAEHRLPIRGLYQTGATTHPGGSVSAAPGRNAAMVILRDLGMSLEQVVAERRQQKRPSAPAPTVGVTPSLAVEAE